MRGMLLGGLFAISAWTANAQTSPAQNLADKALLGQAVSDISRMNRRELDVLTDEVATCYVTGFTTDDSQSNLCLMAAQRYFIGCHADRPIDAVLDVVQGSLGVLRENARLPEVSRSRKADLDQAYRDRVGLIFVELRKAINARNRKLTD